MLLKDAHSQFWLNTSHIQSFEDCTGDSPLTKSSGGCFQQGGSEKGLYRINVLVANPSLQTLIEHLRISEPPPEPVQENKEARIVQPWGKANATMLLVGQRIKRTGEESRVSYICSIKCSSLISRYSKLGTWNKCYVTACGSSMFTFLGGLDAPKTKLQASWF